jgi:hypothetical protein
MWDEDYKKQLYSSPYGDRKKVKAFQAEVVSQMRHGTQRSIPDILNLPVGQADPDFVRMCQEHLRRKWSGQITREEFYKGCEELARLAEQIKKKE